ncbi:MAG: TonB family protein [Acidobacteriota bacterium]
MTYSSLRVKFIVAAVITNLCPLVARPAQSSGDSDTPPREFLEKARASIVVLTGENKDGQPIAPGLGFWIDRNLIATDNRVVQDAVRLRVTVPGQESTPLELIFRDSSHRFAAILMGSRMQGTPLLLGDSDKVAVKDRVYLVNGPDANVAASEGTVKKMIAFNESLYFQVTAPMTSAGRGGPVLNSKGEVIGIAGESPDGKSPGFTIPVAYLTTLLRYRNMEIPTVGTKSGGGMESPKADGAGAGQGSSAGAGMGSGPVPSTGPGQGSNVPGGNAQPGGQERVAIPTLIDTKPVLIKDAQPLYTEEARRNQTQGVVLMRLLVGADGEVKQTKVTKGLPDGLIDQAIVAAYESRFKPATKNGLAVPFWIPIVVEFNLR